MGALEELSGGDVGCAEAEEGGAASRAGAAEVAADDRHLVAACRVAFGGRHGQDERRQEGDADGVGGVDSRGNGEHRHVREGLLERADHVRGVLSPHGQQRAVQQTPRVVRVEVLSREMHQRLTSRGDARQGLAVEREDGGGGDGGRSHREDDRVAGLSRGDHLEHHAHVIHGGECAVQRGVGVGGDDAVHGAGSDAREDDGRVEAEVGAGERERVGAVLQRGRLKREDGGRRVAGEDLEQHLLVELQTHGQEHALAGRHDAAEGGGVDGADGTGRAADGDGDGVGNGRAVDAEFLAAARVEEVRVDEVALDVRLEGGEVEARGVQGEVQRVAGGVRADQGHVALIEAGGAAGVVVGHLLHRTRDELRAVLETNKQPDGHDARDEAEVGAEERQQVRGRALLRNRSQHERGDLGTLQRDGHGVGGLDGELLVAHHHAHLQRGGGERRGIRGERRGVDHTRLDRDVVEDHLEGAARALREVVGDRHEDLLAASQRHGRLRHADGGGVVGVDQRGGQLRPLRADIHRPLQGLAHARRGGALDDGGGDHAAVLRLELRGGEAVGGEHLTAQREVAAAEQDSVAAGGASAGRLAEDGLHHRAGVGHGEEVVGAQPVDLDAPLHGGTEAGDRLAEESRMVGLERARGGVHDALLVGVLHVQERVVVAEVGAVDGHEQTALRGERRVERRDGADERRAVDGLGLEEGSGALRGDGDRPGVGQTAALDGDAAEEGMGQHEVTRRRVVDEGGGVAVVQHRAQVVSAEVVARHVHHLSSRGERVGRARAVDVGDDGRAVAQRGDERLGVLVAHADEEEEVVAHTLHRLAPHGCVGHRDLAVAQLLLALAVLHEHVQGLHARAEVGAAKYDVVPALAVERVSARSSDGGDGGSGEGAGGELAAHAVETDLPGHRGAEATADPTADAVLAVVRAGTQHPRGCVDQRGRGADGVAVGDGVVERARAHVASLEADGAAGRGE